MIHRGKQPVQKPMGKLWTYQALGDLFEVHPKTVSRWFRGFKKFEPTPKTVRVYQSSVDQFIKRRTKKAC